jgi:O-antigen/teichoic acid export membrane protein
MLLAWVQNQGFFYLLGGLLGTRAVAMVSASRMLLVPIPMLLTAIESILRPRASEWVGAGDHRRLVRQLGAMSGFAAVAALGFTVLVYAARELIVVHLLEKEIQQLDLLLACWGIVFMAQVARNAVKVLLQALERFDVLFYLTLVRGVISFGFGYAGIVLLGAPGILVGLAIGEVAYIAVGATTGRRRLREARR